MLLYGGFGPGGALRDTWIWKGAGWREVTPADPNDSPASAHRTCMAYDKKNKQAVLFGGYTDAPPYLTNATWTWDGRKWTLRTPASSPCPRVFAGMAYDAVSEKIVLVGGEANYVSKQDVWLWDDANWTEQTAANLPDLVLAAMAYDIRRGQMVLFGGYNGNVLSTTTWTQRIACAAGVCVPRLATTGHDAADVNASRLAAAGRDTADVNSPLLPIARHDAADVNASRLATAGRDTADVNSPLLPIAGRDAADVNASRSAAAGRDAADVNASRLASAGRDAADVNSPLLAIAGRDAAARPKIATGFGWISSRTRG